MQHYPKDENNNHAYYAREKYVHQYCQGKRVGKKSSKKQKELKQHIPHYK